MLLDQKLDLNEIFTVHDYTTFHVLEMKKNHNSIVIYDPGLYHVSTCKSALSSVDKEDGQLYYRGIKATEKLHLDFLDVAFDIIFSTTESDREHFKNCVSKHFKLYSEQKALLDVIPLQTPPMDVLSIATTALSGLEKKYLADSNDMLEKAAFILASVGITVSYRYTKMQNTPWIDPILSNCYAEQILFQMHSGQSPDKIKKLGKILNTIMILHAEHGQNCSATTVRCIASARGSIYPAIAGAMSAFNGTIHGGASQLVSEMYEEIAEKNLNIDDYINRKVQNKELLMGIGQRTYNRIKNCWDPRVEKMFQILKDPEFNFPEIQNHTNIALKIIDRIIKDPYFQAKNLTPNPDLFNCIFFKLFGAVKTMNTSMLALGRIAGWIANFHEHTCDKLPLTRPCDLSK